MERLMASSIRVRFAPSPTGFMHLGNVRAAVLNYLFARQNKGVFVLRIEDTDAERNLDVAAQKILDNLSWLGLSYDEGPAVGGEYGPYNQSDRSSYYQEKLQELIFNQKAYRCFCTPEELERKRERQIALKKPPRYDRTCLHLSEEKIKAKLAFNLPFIWRFTINHDQSILINDLAKGSITFEMHNFADFPLTRSDGSFTFIFANFVDDCAMKISHVIRGEDHLSNTALQASLYDAFAIKLPVFWHLPMICNAEGKKLSKRDFGFSLDDLIADGFLPEAILNYLSMLGVSSEEEIKSLDQIVAGYDFAHLNSAASVRYDLEKLLWFNHQWINKLSPAQLSAASIPFLVDAFSAEKVNAVKNIEKKLAVIAPSMKRLSDVKSLLSFCFIDPLFDEAVLLQEVPVEQLKEVVEIIRKNQAVLTTPEAFMTAVAPLLQEKKGIAKYFWKSIRYALTGSFSGMNFTECSLLLESQQVESRVVGLLEKIDSLSKA